MAYNPIILTGKADPIGVEVAQIPYSGSPDSISIDFNNADWTSEGGADGSLTINDNALWIFYWNAASWIWAAGPGTYGGNATPATDDDFQPLGVADSQSHLTQNPDGSWRHCDGDPTSENCVDLISPFNSLSDVDVLGAGPDEILAFNGTHWVPFNPQNRTLEELADTDIPSPSEDDILTYNGSVWIATPETDPVYSASAASGIQPGDINSWNEAYNWGDHAIVGYLTDETDPVYSASAASGIDASDITNWDAAYGWGNHANEGYLKSFDETDPVYSASAASGIDASDITNWDEAYGWGNHASGGYITDITGESIKDLSDVNSGMIPTDSQVLTYDDTNGWQSETPAAANVFYDDTLSGMGVSNVKDAIDSLNLVAAAGAVEWVGNHSDYGVPAGTYPTIHEAVNATDWTGHPHADGTVTTAVYIAVNHIVSFGPGASATIYRWVGPKDVTVGVGGSYTTAESDYVPSGTADHESLTNKGTNTHPQIDTHIADGTLHFTQGDISITESQISDLQSYNNNNWISANAGSNFSGEPTSDTDAIAIGSSASAAGTYSIAIGDGASASSSSDSLSIGRGSSSGDIFCIAIGVNAEANVSNDIAIGLQAQTSSDGHTGKIAIGSNAVSSRANSIAIGTSASASAYQTIAIGTNAVANDTNKIIVLTDSAGFRVTSAGIMEITSDGGTGWVGLVKEAPVDGSAYYRKDAAWQNTKPTVEIDDDEPTNPSHGDLWWSEATGIMAVYNVNTWVQVN